MKVAYFDCFAGAAGDMIVGALVDAGADIDALRAELSRLGLGGYGISAERVRRGGLGGVKFSVTLEAGDHGHRRLGDILAMIEAARLAPRAGDRAKRIFSRLAEAEARAHHIGVEEVHFHEIGAIDSIVDVVSACVAIELLGVERVLCSPIPAGSGLVECLHGVLPVPSPATAQLLVGAKTRRSDAAGEATTPTAAAVLTTLAESYGPVPPMEVASVGYGAGTRDEGAVPNLLRVFVGEEDPSGTADSLVELSANLDDCTGEIIGETIQKLLAAGCADAWASPIVMKKSRPAWVLSALCGEGDVAGIERIIFTETTTFGIRRRPCARSKLRRHYETVETPYGPIRVKVGSRGEETITASPEFADCREAAQAHHVSVKEVFESAQATFRRGKEEA